MSGFLTNYKISAEIGVALDGSTWTYATLGAGIDNISEALNEVVQQYQFLNGGGFAENHVTGAAPAWTLSGRRIIGDTAQDYIAGLKYQFDAARKSSLKLTYNISSGSSYSLTVPVTICNIVDIGGGAATDDSVFSCEIRFDGAPSIRATGLTVTNIKGSGNWIVSVSGGNTTSTSTVYYKTAASVQTPAVGTPISELTTAGWTSITLATGSFSLTSSAGTAGNPIVVVSAEDGNVAYAGGTYLVSLS